MGNMEPLPALHTYPTAAARKENAEALLAAHEDQKDREIAAAGTAGAVILDTEVELVA